MFALHNLKWAELSRNVLLWPRKNLRFTPCRRDNSHGCDVTIAPKHTEFHLPLPALSCSHYCHAQNENISIRIITTVYYLLTIMLLYITTAAYYQYSLVHRCSAKVRKERTLLVDERFDPLHGGGEWLPDWAGGMNPRGFSLLHGPRGIISQRRERSEPFTARSGLTSRGREGTEPPYGSREGRALSWTARRFTPSRPTRV